MRYESTDVALQSTGAFDPFPDGWASSLPLEEDVQLSENLWLGGLQSPVTSSQVMDACSPRGLNHNPVRQFGCRYAFFRIEKSKDYPQYEWDSDGLIGKAIFVSRLIHPTTIGTSYSAKIITTDGKVDSIVPGPINSIGSHAWIVANTWRDWLTTSEAKQLAHILPVYLSRKPTERLRHARRHIDHAFHSFYLDQRVASLVTSFESLIKVGRGQLTYQFAERVSQLARHFGETVSPVEARHFYEDRSAFVHGTGPDWADLSEELISLYQKMERTLRKAILSASIDSNSSKLFESDKTVESAFPI